MIGQPYIRVPEVDPVLSFDTERRGKTIRLSCKLNGLEAAGMSLTKAQAEDLIKQLQAAKRGIR